MPDRHCITFFTRRFIAGFMVAAFIFLAAGPACEAAAESPFPLTGIGTFVLPEWLEVTAAKGVDEQQSGGAQQYDLVGLSGGSWHYARLVSYRMDSNSGSVAMLFGFVEANPKLLGELARTLLEKKLAENGGRILEWPPARRSQLGGRSVPMISARLIMTEKVPLPMTATVYVFSHKERVHAMGLFVPDSDRIFWQKLFSDIAEKMNWE